jgi:hypothetical protein
MAPDVEFARGAKRPVRIAQQLAREDHKSACPFAMISLACVGVVISPTAPVAMAAWRLICSANGT